MFHVVPPNTCESTSETRKRLYKYVTMRPVTIHSGKKGQGLESGDLPYGSSFATSLCYFERITSPH